MKNVLLFCFVCLLIACQTNKDHIANPLPEGVIQEWEAKLFVEMDNQLGEGAIWNHVTQEFWHIDIESKKFFITEFKDRSYSSFDLDQRIGTIVPSENGNAIIALENGIFDYNLDSKQKKLISNPLSNLNNIRLNDGKCDANGRLWVGSMGLEQQPYRAALYQIEGKKIEQRLDSITISNGIVWSKDNKTMYYIDTPDEQVKAFDFDLATGSISNERVVVEIGGLGYPDGMAIDSEDMLWIALWDGNMVGRWDPSTGKLIGKVNVPAHNITSCAFVGAALDSLVITTARVDMSDTELEAKPLAGSLFVVVPGVTGVESNFYRSR